MSTARDVVWTDVSPRDGLQNIKETVATEVKVRLVRGLLAAGMPRVEATSFVSAAWVPQLADAADVLAALGDEEMAHVRVLIPNRRGLEMALERGVRRVLVTIGATDSFNRRNVNRSVDESRSGIAEIAGLARDAGCIVDVAVSVAFGCPFEGRVEPDAVVRLCEALATVADGEIGIADTIGVATPPAVTAMVERVGTAFERERLSVHVHDTRGLGVANVVAAYQAGVDRFDGSAAGVGGCPFAPRSTGNVCTEDALAALESLGARTGVDIAALCTVSERLAADLGQTLPGKLYRAGVWSAAG